MRENGNRADVRSLPSPSYVIPLPFVRVTHHTVKGRNGVGRYVSHHLAVNLSLRCGINV